MIIIDYPPGGLGNFVAQVITDTLKDSEHSSFHRILYPIYDIKLVQKSKELFQSLAKDWKPKHSVAVVHSYGDLQTLNDLKKKFNAKIFTIRPFDNWPQLFLNCEEKATADNKENKNRNWSSNEYYNHFQNLKTNWGYSAIDEILNFDNFYKDELIFCQTLKNLNPSADFQKIYKIFQKTQMPLIDKLQQIIQASKSKQNFKNLSALDQALIRVCQELY